jgi:hypothetical protein
MMEGIVITILAVACVIAVMIVLRHADAIDHLME